MDWLRVAAFIGGAGLIAFMVGMVGVGAWLHRQAGIPSSVDRVVREDRAEQAARPRAPRPLRLAHTAGVTNEQDRPAKAPESAAKAVEALRGRSGRHRPENAAQRDGRA